MKRKTTLLSILLSPLLFLSSSLLAFTASGPDTCTVNDDCQQAILINGVVSNQGFICITGCNMYASPDTLLQSCQMGDFPTVWYRLPLDESATVMNLEVYSTDVESPVISLFKTQSTCDELEQIPMPGDNAYCVIGVDGVAKAIGIPAQPSATYYIAISSLISIGGDFELCISAQSTGFKCVIDRDIEITARSNGGPLEGPFDPDETVSICLNVNEYSAANNGCQWFQGMVPVFGNGWDPTSFDINGQPINATINGNSMAEPENGIYSTAKWEWFTNADYHYDHPTMTIGDLDGNGVRDMCNSSYEVDCPHQGIEGACCNPCWIDTIGTILPAGWFAYNINGSCATPGPPVAVDWGDGGHCGGGMGPWQFCFDLKTRDVPDCMGDSTKMDLSIGFFTFADGETGAWTGNASICALDVPLKLSYKAKCGRIATHDLEHLPDLCSGDILEYRIEEQDISHWEWNISPHWAVPYLTNRGDNGFNIEAPLVNNTDEPVDITAVLIGYTEGSNDKVIRQFTFKLKDAVTCETVSTESPKVDLDKLKVYPIPANESVMLEWSFDLERDATVEIYNSHGMVQDILNVSSADGQRKRIDMSDWSQGIYYISLSNGDFRYVARMVKM
jgi:hypothetical protein